ncbi:unnamed protein product [Cylicostephanus goldi]|uniref:Uncharacterized protein n=1 Tax=Cylicostephanus goldi TaxID=71465 RepID=A0A3P6TRK2_CYLGO|nr:unnamed protein product [Cylicostephanus goldi]
MGFLGLVGGTPVTLDNTGYSGKAGEYLVTTGIAGFLKGRSEGFLASVGNRKLLCGNGTMPVIAGARGFLGGSKVEVTTGTTGALAMGNIDCGGIHD